MKLSSVTALSLAWLYGTVAGLVLPHGPLVLVCYGLVLLAGTGIAHLGQRAITHQLALAEFRQDMALARRRAAHYLNTTAYS